MKANYKNWVPKTLIVGMSLTTVLSVIALITGADKQGLLLETLRVLKKGGTFAIHDLMGKNRYGDMESFCQKLKEMGYADVQMIDSTDGLFMTKKEAGRLMLKGPTLLLGRK